MTDLSKDAPASAPLLSIQDLEVQFSSDGKPFTAVSGASLTVYPGQTVAIVGESGSGKSTTAAAVLGLLQGTGKVTGGTITFDGRELAKAPESTFRHVRGSGIGYVPQDPMSNLNPMWKIGFQISETLAANGVAKGAAAKQRAVELLAEAGLTDAEKRVNQYPHEFSGGMRQRALIAIGLACRPKLLIADEPTSALDVTVQRQILDSLDRLTDELGTAVLLITHDLGLAAERASHLVVMYRGTIVESGPALEILQNPQHEYTKRLVRSAPSLASRRLVSAHTTSGDSESAPVATVRPVLQVDNLVKDFTIRGSLPFQSSDFRAVNDVSFSLAPGKTTAIVGESGSGKSTVAQMVLGLLKPTSGSIAFEGRDITTMNRKTLRDFRRRVQPVFQNPYGSLDPMYSIYRCIAEPLVVHGEKSKTRRLARVKELLDLVSLPQSTMQKFPNELSGGQRQRIAIARALALQPDVIVCDEAVSALDVLVQAQILTLLTDLQAEFGLSYVFITHDLAVVRQVADEVLVMQKGSVVERGTTDDVFERPQSAYTWNLLDSIPGGKIELAG